MNTYIELNNQLNIPNNGKIQLDKDKEAVRAFFLEHVNKNTVFFYSLEEKISYLIREGYIDKTVITDKYSMEFIKKLFKFIYSKKFRFDTFMGAYRFYKQYAMRTDDGERYLERYEDRVAFNALTMGDGDEELAMKIADELINRRYQPATPTFLNAGRLRRGEYVSCFPEGTLIDTINGQKEIQLVKVGDKVLSHDGKFHEVEETIKNRNKQELVEIKHYGHSKSIKSTPEHPVLIYTERDVISIIEGDGADENKRLYWVKAEDVKPRDFVIASSIVTEGTPKTYDLLEYVDNTFDEDNGYLRKKNFDKRATKKNQFSESVKPVKRFVKEGYNLGLLMGWYLSEGYVSKRKGNVNGVHFTLGTHEIAFIDEVVQSLYDVFGVVATVKNAKSDNSTRISVHSRIVGEFFLSMFGSGYGNKKIEGSFIESDSDMLLGLLHGAFRGDGHTTNGAMVLDFVNPKLIDSIQLILNKIGILSRVRTYKNGKGNLTGQVCVPGIAGINEDFILSTRKNLENYVGQKSIGKNLKSSIFYKMVHGHIAYEVKEVNRTSEVPEYVYNLHVKDTHTYTINGVIVHNCFLIQVEDSMSSIGRTLNSALQLSKLGGGVG